MRYEPKEVIITQAGLKICLEMWQAILGLSDWHVTIRMGNLLECQHPTEGSTCTIAIESLPKFAEIIMIHPEQCAKGLLPNDMELSIVHELVHLIVPSIENEEKLEVAVWQIAKALVTLARKEGVYITDGGRLKPLPYEEDIDE